MTQQHWREFVGKLMDSFRLFEVSLQVPAGCKRYRQLGFGQFPDDDKQCRLNSMAKKSRRTCLRKQNQD
jgi:hypothetical protein